MNEEEIIYHVTLKFHEDKLTENEVTAVLKEHFNDESILERNGHNVKAVWSVPWYEGIGELENGLFYVLEGGDYGDLVKVEKISGDEDLYDYMYESDEGNG